MTDLVFVYGTLKRGEPNYAHMQPYRFIDVATSQFADWDILEFTYLNLPKETLTPILTKGTHYITGEIYEVKPTDLPILDEFEGEFYIRQKIKLTDNKVAWCYMIHPTNQPTTLQPHRPQLRVNNMINWTRIMKKPA